MLFESLCFLNKLDVDYIVPGHGPVVDKKYLYKQAAVVYDWIQEVGYAMAKGWTKEECIRRISFADRCPVDIGQEEVMDYIQTANVAAVWEYLSRK